MINLLRNKTKGIKDFFGYSRTERNGILVLFIILLVTILFNILLPFIITPDKTDFTEFKEKILAFEKRQAVIEDSLNQIKSTKASFYNDKKIELTPFYFDPNNLPVSKWKSMGLKDWQIEVIKNYELKGGKFNQPEDLDKMYSISHEEYAILEPFIRIEKIDKQENKHTLKPFQFDPNTITENELLKMGLQKNLIYTIINYRDKGGKFYSLEDFKKLYTLSDEDFAILEPFIVIEKDTNHIAIKPIKISDTLLIDINVADSLDLLQLKGIGPSFSRRIIKYRDLLGGFYDKSQLLEVYGMDESRYEGIKDHIYVNEDSYQKIDVNKATIKEMIKHPYIEFYIAKSIVTYRNEAGSIKELEEIKSIKLIYAELYQKIVPYLTIN